MSGLIPSRERPLHTADDSLDKDSPDIDVLDSRVDGRKIVRLGIADDYRADHAEAHMNIARVDIGALLVQRDAEAVRVELRAPHRCVGRPHSLDKRRLVGPHASPDNGIAWLYEEHRGRPLGSARTHDMFLGARCLSAEDQECGHKPVLTQGCTSQAPA